MKNDSLALYIDGTVLRHHNSFIGSANMVDLKHAHGITEGTTEGRFFGNEASAVAGIAVFNKPQYDTSFGGVQVPSTKPK
ncbi:hypothetical protein ACU5P1_16690 [Pseudomonas plecoglossicida]|uniref:Transferrin-binding protein B C-lobe/N-lobe beta barrel domain-containing protein n=1 Tax=Pseudomonas plecoglossicida TaxID=70775 RepID=A0AAD0QVK7_PSEDL|nr:hypothetical protein [Pseudomonas plecoglossicida]AXM95560.1 hypothetical protein DVB73_06970 [Pseudomonas plecoglossicida]QLB56308.1 transferrin-binding protein-like solute binding protein [Pseudomonas plecoglossicida]GLR37920.1 hypothetical protein GCM10011247_33180 [Pseudomonas plecoglossicida]